MEPTPGFGTWPQGSVRQASSLGGRPAQTPVKPRGFTGRRMDARSVVSPHRELGFGLKRKEAPSQATRWVTLNDFMLVEISRSQNRHCRCHLTKESSRIHRDTKEWGSLGGGGWAVPAPWCPGLMSCVPSRFLCRSPTPSGTVIGDGPQGGDPVNPDGEGGALRGPSPSLSLSLPLPLPSLSLSPPLSLSLPPPLSLLVSKCFFPFVPPLIRAHLLSNILYVPSSGLLVPVPGDMSCSRSLPPGCPCGPRGAGRPDA